MVYDSIGEINRIRTLSVGQCSNTVTLGNQSQKPQIYKQICNNKIFITI